MLYKIAIRLSSQEYFLFCYEKSFLKVLNYKKPFSRIKTPEKPFNP